MIDLGELYFEKLLIFGGPYSNFAATKSLLKLAKQQGFSSEQIFCTGDIVAYCAEPSETLNLIIDSGIHCIMGNCEESLANQKNDCGCGFEENTQCNVLSNQWFSFSQSKINEQQRLWMSQLPNHLSFHFNSKKFVLVHGSYSQINQFVFSSTPDEIKLAELKAVQADVIVGGHCGLSFGQKIGHQYWLNSGAIGLPANDGLNKTWYLTLHKSKGKIQVEWNQLEYPWEVTKASMLKEGLHAYAECISTGLWPSMDVLPEKEKTMQGKVNYLTPMTI